MDDEKAGLLCPHCEGEGGTEDYWGAWSECPCCHGGLLTSERLAEYNRGAAEMDAEIEKMMAEDRP